MYKIYRSFNTDCSKKYTVDCFTVDTVVSGKFPENTYNVDSLDDVDKIIRNVDNDISGICQVKIWINKKY